MSRWTPARDDQLRALHAEGLSFGQIARVIGGISRNAAVGRARRLTLPDREPRKSSHAARHRKAFTLAHSPNPPEPQPMPEMKPAAESKPVVLENGSHVTTLTLNARTCRWPIGDPAEADFHYCGHPPRLGAPYCQAHARIAHQPQPTKRQRSTAA